MSVWANRCNDVTADMNVSLGRERRYDDVSLSHTLSLSLSFRFCVHLYAHQRFPPRARAHTHSLTLSPARCLIHRCAQSTRVEGYIKQREEATRYTRTETTSDHKQQDSEAESKSTKHRPSALPELRVYSPASALSGISEETDAEVGSKLSGVWSESLCSVALVEVKCAETWNTPGRVWSRRRLWNSWMECAYWQLYSNFKQVTQVCMSTFIVNDQSNVLFICCCF